MTVENNREGKQIILAGEKFKPFAKEEKLGAETNFIETEFGPVGFWLVKMQSLDLLPRLLIALADGDDPASFPYGITTIFPIGRIEPHFLFGASMTPKISVGIPEEEKEYFLLRVNLLKLGNVYVARDTRDDVSFCYFNSFQLEGETELPYVSLFLPDKPTIIRNIEVSLQRIPKEVALKP